MSLTDSLQRASGLQYSTILYFGEVGSVCPVQVTALPCKCSSARIPDQSKTLKPFTFQSVALFFSVQPFYRSHLRLNHTFFFPKVQPYHKLISVVQMSSISATSPCSLRTFPGLMLYSYVVPPVSFDLLIWTCRRFPQGGTQEGNRIPSAPLNETLSRLRLCLWLSSVWRAVET